MTHRGPFQPQPFCDSVILHAPQPDTASDVGDNSSDTGNAGTDLNSRCYQIMLAGWAAVHLLREQVNTPDEAFTLSSTLEDSNRSQHKLCLEAGRVLPTG